MCIAQEDAPGRGGLWRLWSNFTYPLLAEATWRFDTVPLPRALIHIHLNIHNFMGMLGRPWAGNTGGQTSRHM